MDGDHAAQEGIADLIGLVDPSVDGQRLDYESNLKHLTYI